LKLVLWSPSSFSAALATHGGVAAGLCPIRQGVRSPVCVSPSADCPILLGSPFWFGFDAVVATAQEAAAAGGAAEHALLPTHRCATLSFAACLCLLFNRGGESVLGLSMRRTAVSKASHPRYRRAIPSDQAHCRVTGCDAALRQGPKAGTQNLMMVWCGGGDETRERKGNGDAQSRASCRRSSSGSGPHGAPSLTEPAMLLHPRAAEHLRSRHNRAHEN